MYTKARMEIYPLGGHDDSELPTHMFCNNPQWKGAEQAKLDISVNGQDYSGDFPFTFYDALDLYRIAPMAGPNIGNTRVKIFGSGYTTTKEDVFLKWGVLDTEKVLKAEVMDYIWNENDFLTNVMLPGSEALIGYKKESYNFEKKDADLADGQKLKTWVAHSPKLPNWTKTHGGPIYLGVGEQIAINTTFYNQTDEDDPTKIKMEVVNQTIYQFSHSFVEFFYYQQPVVKKVQPYSGLTRGGTRIEVSGAWFAYKPEYGVIPHCRIGPHVTRAKYYSTVRVVC